MTKNLKRTLSKHYLILAIITLSLTLRLLFLDNSYIFWDESVYLMNAKTIAGQYAGYQELGIRPPLLTLMITPLTLFKENFETISKIALATLNSLLVLTTYLIGSNWNKKIGIISAFFVSILPYHVMSSSWVMTDGPAAILMITSIYMYFKGYKQGKPSQIYAGGILLGLAILMKFTSLILIIILLPLFILNHREIKTTIKSLLFAFIVTLPYLAINHISHGNALYGMEKAFNIGNTLITQNKNAPISEYFTAFYDLFGWLIIILMLIGIIMFIRKEIVKEESPNKKKENMFWIYCFLLFIPYYVYIFYEGHTELWWDIERFMLWFVPIGITFGAYAIVRVHEKLGKTTRTVFVIALIILAAISFANQYERFSKPSITHEEGLREVTKEMGLSLKNREFDNLMCLGNCPPIAYYSDKKIKVVYDIRDYKLEREQKGIIFDEKLKLLGNSYEELNSFCKEKHCVYLVGNRENQAR